MAELALQDLLTVGSGSPVYVDASSGGDEALNLNGRTRIWVINDNGTSINLIFTSNQDSNFGPYTTLTFPVPAATFYPIPALDPRRFNNAAGKITWTYSTHVDVDVAAVEDATILKDPVV